MVRTTRSRLSGACNTTVLLAISHSEIPPGRFRRVQRIHIVFPGNKQHLLAPVRQAYLLSIINLSLNELDSLCQTGEFVKLAYA